MKKLIAILLTFVLVLNGCASSIQTEPVSSAESVEETANTENAVNDTVEVPDDGIIHVVVGDDEPADDSEYVYEPEFTSLSDAELQEYVEDALYAELVSSLNSDQYYVENVSAVYISQEYIDELAYNSKPNVYFGYTLEEIDALFQGTRYVFTLGEDGETVVRSFEEYDNSYEQIIKNVAMGTGVILVGATVSAVKKGAGTSVVSFILAVAKEAASMMVRTVRTSVSLGALGEVLAGVVTGIETGDMSQVKSAALAASNEYKWGAIAGAISNVGGGKYAKVVNSALQSVSSFLPISEAAAIQMKTHFPQEVISQFHSMEEFEIFQNANLYAEMVNGKLALVRDDIDLYNIVDEMGRNNLERMTKGLSPVGLDDAGNTFKYELYYIGQESDATLAVLTAAEHDNVVLHGFKAVSELSRTEFGSVISHFWKTMAKMLAEGEI